MPIKMMKNKKFFLSITKVLTLLVAVFLLAGCVPANLKFNCTKDDSSIKIGALVPLTGSKKTHGARLLDGMILAVEQLNYKRGISNKKVELIAIDIADSNNTPNVAMQKLLNAKVAAAIVGCSSLEVAPFLPLAPKYRIPLVIPIATDDEQVGYNRFIFRSSYTNSQQADAVASYLWYWRQIKRIGVMTNMSPDSEEERAVTREVAQQFQDLGGAVLHTQSYIDDNFKSALTNVLTFGPQAVVISSPAKRAAKMFKELRQQEFIGIICGTDTWEDPDFYENLKGVALPGDCFFTSFYSDENQSNQYKQFKESFLEKFYRTPGAYEAQGFDAVNLLAIGLSGAYNMYEFEKNWMNIRDYMGVTGSYTMLHDGNVDRTIYINSLSTFGKRLPHPIPRQIRNFQYSRLDTYKNL